MFYFLDTDPMSINKLLQAIYGTLAALRRRTYWPFLVQFCPFLARRHAPFLTIDIFISGFSHQLNKLIVGCELMLANLHAYFD